MTRLTLAQVLLRNLEQKIGEQHKRIYMSQDEAYEKLKRYSGQDFGYDAKAWRSYIQAAGGELKAFPHYYNQE